METFILFCFSWIQLNQILSTGLLYPKDDTFKSHINFIQNIYIEFQNKEQKKTQNKYINLGKEATKPLPQQ